MNLRDFESFVKPGEPVTAELLAKLESRLPPVASEMFNFMLDRLPKGERMDHLFIEKDGVFGSTEFSPISNDGSGMTQLFYRDALAQLGVTSAAAMCEATARPLAPGEIMPRSDAPGTDLIMVIWWERGLPGGMWGFRVQGKRPGPRTILQESVPRRVSTRFAGLLEPVDVVAMIRADAKAGAKGELDWLRGELAALVAPVTTPQAQTIIPQAATVQ